MASPRPGDFPASIAVLGLLIEQPDTIAGVALRLEEAHPDARWARSIVYNSVSTHLEKSFVRVVRAHPRRSLDRYEVTPDGIEHFRESLRESSTLPAMRDELRAKLRYVETEEEFQAAIGDIRQQEEACVRAGAAAVKRYRTARRLGHLQPVDEQDRRTIVRRALMIDEVKLWSERAEALQRLRQHLQDPRGENDTLETGAGDG
jgi:DNA-binding PadR family transcriptional regulator